MLYVLLKDIHLTEDTRGKLKRKLYHIYVCLTICYFVRLDSSGGYKPSVIDYGIENCGPIMDMTYYGIGQSPVIVLSQPMAICAL